MGEKLNRIWGLVVKELLQLSRDKLLPAWLARFVPTLDFRKWKQIRAWAEDIKPRLLG